MTCVVCYDWCFVSSRAVVISDGLHLSREDSDAHVTEPQASTRSWVSVRDPVGIDRRTFPKGHGVAGSRVLQRDACWWRTGGGACPPWRGCARRT